MPQKSQNTIIQDALKHCNQFRSLKIAAIRLLNTITDTVITLKVETTVKDIDQPLLGFVTIDVLNIKQHYPSSQYIITLPMTPIINISFNKTPISWELIHHRLLHRSYSVMKAMYCHKTLNGLPKHCIKQLNKTPCKICYTEKLQLSPK